MLSGPSVSWRDAVSAIAPKGWRSTPPCTMSVALALSAPKADRGVWLVLPPCGWPNVSVVSKGASFNESRPRSAKVVPDAADTCPALMASAPANASSPRTPLLPGSPTRRTSLSRLAVAFSVTVEKPRRPSVPIRSMASASTARRVPPATDVSGAAEVSAAGAPGVRLVRFAIVTAGALRCTCDPPCASTTGASSSIESLLARRVSPRKLILSPARRVSASKPESASTRWGA